MPEPNRPKRDHQVSSSTSCRIDDGSLVRFHQHWRLSSRNRCFGFESMPLPTLFGAVAAFAFGAAIVLILLIRPTVRLMSGVK